MAQPVTTNLLLHFSNNLNISDSYNVTRVIVRHCNLNQPHQDIKMSSRQAIFAFIVSVLLSFLQVKYQGKDQSPFETHPKTMLVAIASLLLYCLLYDAKLKFSSNGRAYAYYYVYFVKISMALTGPLSLACVLSVLFPEFLSPLLFPLSFMFSLCQLPPSQLKTIWDWLMNVAINIIQKIYHQPHQQRRRGGVALIQLNGFPEYAIPNRVDVLPV